MRKLLYVFALASSSGWILIEWVMFPFSGSEWTARQIRCMALSAVLALIALAAKDDRP